MWSIVSLQVRVAWALSRLQGMYQHAILMMLLPPPPPPPLDDARWMVEGARGRLDEI
jgi:hypothetical protein